MDFILGLPDIICYNQILTVTCKFTKRVTFILGKDTQIAGDQVFVLIDRLYIEDQGLLSVIISNCDPKFLLELWLNLFKGMKVKLLYSTAYYPQTDGQSKCINQTAEIALQYYLAALDNVRDWPKVLPAIQAALNASLSAIMSKSLYKLAYRISLSNAINLYD